MENQKEVYMQIIPMICLLFWYDKEKSWTIQSVSTILRPAKFKEGDLVIARYKGKPFKAAIIKIRGNKADLIEDKEKLIKLINEKDLTPNMIMTQMGLPVEDDMSLNEHCSTDMPRKRQLPLSDMPTDDQNQQTSDSDANSNRNMDAVSVQSPNEGVDNCSKDKKKKKTPKPVKEKSDKKKQEELDKAASNLELVELAIQKSKVTEASEISETQSPTIKTPVKKNNVLHVTPRRSPRRHVLSTSTSPSFNERPSTSSVVGSAFRALDTSVTDTDTQQDSRIGYLETCVFQLQQDVAQQREWINWLCLENQKLQSRLTSVNVSEQGPQESRNMQLALACPSSEAQEYPSSQDTRSMQCTTTNTMSPSTSTMRPSTSTMSPSTSTMSPSTSTMSPSASTLKDAQIFTKDQLLHLLARESDFTKAVKLLFRKLFTQEEIAGRSLKGQKPNKTGKAKPALENQDKLELLYEVIKEKWPVIPKAMINIKLADMMKPSVNRSTDDKPVNSKQH